MVSFSPGSIFIKYDSISLVLLVEIVTEGWSINLTLQRPVDYRDQVARTLKISSKSLYCCHSKKESPLTSSPHTEVPNFCCLNQLLWLSTVAVFIESYWVLRLQCSQKTTLYRTSHLSHHIFSLILELVIDDCLFFYSSNLLLLLFICFVFSLSHSLLYKQGLCFLTSLQHLNNVSSS